MADGFIVPIDADVAPLEAKLRHIGEVINEIGAEGARGGADPTTEAFAAQEAELKTLLSLMKEYRSEQAGTGTVRGDGFAPLEKGIKDALAAIRELNKEQKSVGTFSTESIQAYSAAVAKVAGQWEAVGAARLEALRPIAQETLVSPAEGRAPAVPLVLEPTPGAPATPAAPPPTAQDRLLFAENENLTLQNPSAEADAKSAAEQKRRSTLRAAAALEQEAIAAEALAAADTEAAVEVKTLYHGTTAERLAGIQTQGLNAPGSSREAAVIHSFDNEEAAAEYARRRFTAPGETPAVVSFPANEGTTATRTGPIVPGGQPQTFYETPGSIAASEVKLVAAIDAHAAAEQEAATTTAASGKKRAAKQQSLEEPIAPVPVEETAAPVAFRDLNAGEKSVRKDVIDFRKQLKEEYDQQAKDLYDELVHQEVLPIAPLPPVTEPEARARAIRGGGYDQGGPFFQLEPALAQDNRFFAQAKDGGRTPEQVLNGLNAARGESGLVGTDAGAALDELLAKMRKIKELESYARPSVETGFDRDKHVGAAEDVQGLLQTNGFLASDASRLAPDIAYGGNPNQVARKITSQYEAVLTALDNLPEPPPRPEPFRGPRTAVPYDPYDENGFFDGALHGPPAPVVPVEPRIADPRYRGDQRTYGEILQAREEQQLALPTPTGNGAQGEATISKTTKAEESLAAVLNRKVGFLEEQIKATQAATRAENLLAKQAEKAGDAKGDQAFLLRKQLEAQAANPEAAAREQAKKEALAERQRLAEEKKNALSGTPEVRANPPGSPQEKGEELAKSRLDDARANAVAQEKLAEDDRYARSVAKIRIAYERSASQIAEELIESTKLADAQKNYAEVVTRNKTAQAQLEAIVNKRLANEDGYTEALAQSRAAQAQITLKTQQALAAIDGYTETLAQTALVRQQEKADIQLQLATNQEYIEATAEDANARRLQAAETKRATLAGVGLETTPLGNIAGPALTPESFIEEQRAAALKGLSELEAQNVAIAATTKAENELAVIAAKKVEAQARIEAGLETEAELQERAAVLNRELTTQQNLRVAAAQRAAYAELKASGAGSDQIGTVFQRLQSNIASREGNFKDPTQFLQLGQFLQSRFLTTAGFAVSGVATYAAFAGLQKLLTNSKELEITLSEIQAQFDSLGQGSGFERFREGIRGIAADTGIAANEVAVLAERAKGAFGAGAGGNLSDTGVLQQVQAGAEFSKLTGVSTQDVSNNVFALAKTFGISVEEIGDKIVALGQRTGTSAKEMVDALGQIAPIAHAAGESIDSIAGIIATGAEFSGRSANAIAQSFARVFSSIEQNGSKIDEFFHRFAPSQEPKILDALSRGDSLGVFREIAAIYAKLSTGQQTDIRNLLGRPRDIQDLVPVLENYQAALENTKASQNSAGTQASAYAQLQDTLGQQLHRLTASFSEFGEAILHLGVSDFLQDIAKTFGLVITAVSALVQAFSSLNDITGGMLGRMAAFAAELFIVLKVMKQIAEIELFRGLGGFVSGVGAEGGLLSRIGGSFNPGSAGGVIGEGGLSGGRIGQLFRKGAGAAAVGETSALTATELATTGATTGAIATETAAPLLTGPQALIAIPAIIGLAGYLKFRGDISKEAEQHLNTYRKLDRAALVDLIAKEKGSTSETVGRFLSGAGTDKDEMLKALRNLDTTNTLDPALTQLAVDAKGHSDLLTAIQDVQDNLNKNKDDKDAFNKAKAVVDGLSTIAKQSDAERGVTVGAADLLGQGGNTKGNLYNTLNKQQSGLADLITAEAQNKTQEAKDIRDKFFGGSQAATSDLSKALANAQKEFDTKQTVAGLSDTDLQALQPSLKGLKGPELDAAVKSINQGLEVQQIAQGFNADLASLQVKKSAYQQGFITPQDYIGALNSDKDAAKRNLAKLLNNPTSDPALIQQVAQEVSQDTGELASEYKKRFDAVTAAAAFSAQISGLTGLDADRAAATSALNALKSQPPAIDDAGHANQLAEAKDYITKQQAYVVELAKGADSLKEAEDIVRKGYKIPPALQAIFNIESIKGIGGKLGHDIADLGVTADGAFGSFTSELAIAMTQGKAAVQKFIENQIIRLAKLRGEAAKAGIDPSKYDQALEDLQRIDENLGGLPASAPGKGKPPPTAPVGAEAVAAALAAGDPVAEANAALQKGIDDLRVAPKGSEAAKQAAAEIIAAKKAQANAANAIAAGALDIAAALANGDPIKEATIAIQKAVLQINTAHSAAESEAGKAALISAQNQLHDAYVAIGNAQYDVAKALADDDPIKAAQIAFQQAQYQAANAKGEAERLNAVAAEITAQHQLRDAMNAIADAQANIVIATLNAAGDVVAAAQATVRQDKADLDRYLQQHPGATVQNNVVAAGKFQKYITDQAAARDTLLQQQESDIQFQLDTNKISTGQAIVKLQNLLSTANITEAERQNIERQIYQLKQQVTKDLQFNLPSDLKLPTLYEARRFNESSGSYQDNRQIKITVDARGVSADQVVSKITEAINGPPRFGVRNRTY